MALVNYSIFLTKQIIEVSFDEDKNKEEVKWYGVNKIIPIKDNGKKIKFLVLENMIIIMVKILKIIILVISLIVKKKALVFITFLMAVNILAIIKII